MPVASRRLRDGAVIGYSYDNLNRVTERNLPATPWYNIDRAYTYDNFGRLLTVNGNNSGDTILNWRPWVWALAFRV